MKGYIKWLNILIVVCVLAFIIYQFISITYLKKVTYVTNEKRYVVLSPEVVEIIAIIEGTKHIVGVTEECNFPVEYPKSMVVGKFGSIKKEAVLKLKPSIIFASSLEQQAVATELAKLGIKTIIIYPKSINDMIEAVRTVGKVIGQKTRADNVADSLMKIITNYKNLPPLKPAPKVYLEIYREPLMSVSDSSFVGQLIELAGGDNIFAKLERDYSRVKAEDVVMAKPDIMICYSQDTLENITKRMGWQDIPAIKNRNIYFEKDINPDWLLRAGPRCLLGVKKLRELLINTNKYQAVK